MRGLQVWSKQAEAWVSIEGFAAGGIVATGTKAAAAVASAAAYNPVPRSCGPGGRVWAARAANSRIPQFRICGGFRICVGPLQSRISALTLTKKSVAKNSLGVSVQQPKFFPIKKRMHVVGLIGRRPISLTLEGYSAATL